MKAFLGLAALLAAALALALPALAADGPTELDVWDYQANAGRAAQLDVDLFVASTAAPTAKAVIYVPAGFGVNTGAAPGTELGTVFATLLSGSASVKGTGKIVVDSPANYLAQTCAAGPHAAVWILKVAASGQEVDVPVYVDPATPDVSRFAAYTLQACFAAPSAVGNLRLGEVDLELTSGVTNPSATASHVWRALLTPFGADGAPAFGSTMELQASVPLPQHLKLTGRYDLKRHVVVLSGSVVGAGHPRAGVNVHFLTSPKGSFSNAKTFGSARTDKQGRFKLTHRLTSSTVILAYMNQYYADACVAAMGAAPCTTATIAPPPPAGVRITLRH